MRTPQAGSPGAARVVGVVGARDRDVCVQLLLEEVELARQSLLVPGERTCSFLDELDALVHGWPSFRAIQHEDHVEPCGDDRDLCEAGQVDPEREP